MSAPPTTCPFCGLTSCKLCNICIRQYCKHTACEVCGDPVQHHPNGATPPEEWEGLARMAGAGMAAGRALTPAEHKALERYPRPARLGMDGYRRPDGSKPPWAR